MPTFSVKDSVIVDNDQKDKHKFLEIFKYFLKVEIEI